MGVLEKKISSGGKNNVVKEKIYSSWWFDNGSYKTINQFSWRWKMICGEKEFCIVNVNAAEEEDMLRETKNIINQNIFQ
jgi:hypothetical protein